VSHRIRVWLAVLTVAVDAVAAALGFYLSYRLREAIPFPTELRLGPFRNYLGLQAIYVASIIAVFFLSRLYHPKRDSSRIDLFYRLLSGIAIGTILST